MIQIIATIAIVAVIAFGFSGEIKDSKHFF